jgi:hypothetical protein
VKTERAINNGQSREPGNIGHARNRTKINKTQGNANKIQHNLVIHGGKNIELWKDRNIIIIMQYYLYIYP